MSRWAASGNICFAPLISMASRLTSCWRIAAIHNSGASFPRESAGDDAILAAIVDHYRPARFLSEGDQPAAAREQAVRLDKASQEKIPEQHLSKRTSVPSSELFGQPEGSRRGRQPPPLSKGSK